MAIFSSRILKIYVSYLRKGVNHRDIMSRAIALGKNLVYNGLDIKILSFVIPAKTYLSGRQAGIQDSNLDPGSGPG